MIVAITPIHWNYRPSTDLGGSFSLDPGKMLLTSDSGRLVVGVDEDQGNPNFDRDRFPFQHVEILTENSPRVRELFGRNARNQTRGAFFIPTVVRPGTDNVKYTDEDGGFEFPLQIVGEAVSAVVEYVVAVDGVPIQMGLLRVLGAVGTNDLSVQNIGPSTITFEVNNISVEGKNAIAFRCTNHGTDTATMVLRLTSIVL